MFAVFVMSLLVILTFPAVILSMSILLFKLTTIGSPKLAPSPLVTVILPSPVIIAMYQGSISLLFKTTIPAETDCKSLILFKRFETSRLTVPLGVVTVPFVTLILLLGLLTVKVLIAGTPLPSGSINHVPLAVVLSLSVIARLAPTARLTNGVTSSFSLILTALAPILLNAIENPGPVSVASGKIKDNAPTLAFMPMRS